MPLAYYGAFQAPSLPIGGLQGPLGTQSVLAIPKGEPPAKAGFPLGSPSYIIMSNEVVNMMSEVKSHEAFRPGYYK